MKEDENTTVTVPSAQVILTAARQSGQERALWAKAAEEEERRTRESNPKTNP